MGVQVRPSWCKIVPLFPAAERSLRALSHGEEGPTCSSKPPEAGAPNTSRLGCTGYGSLPERGRALGPRSRASSPWRIVRVWPMLSQTVRSSSSEEALTNSVEGFDKRLLPSTRRVLPTRASRERVATGLFGFSVRLSSDSLSGPVASPGSVLAPIVRRRRTGQQRPMGSGR